MQEYNAFEQNISQSKSSNIVNQWRWDKNVFFKKDNYKLAYLPSYYDANMPDSSFILNGPLGDSLRIVATDFVSEDRWQNARPYLEMKPGAYSLLGKKKGLFPNEAIRLVLSRDITALPYEPDKRFIPELAYYWRISDGVSIDKQWKLTNTLPLLNHYRITKDGSYKLEVGGYEELSRTDTVIFSGKKLMLKNKLKTSEYKVFMLQQFPAVNIMVVENDGTFLFDTFNGLVFVPATNNITQLTVNYKVRPMFTYVPKNRLNSNAKLEFEKSSDENNYFVILKNSGQV